MLLRLNERGDVMAFATHGSIEGAIEVPDEAVYSLGDFIPEKYRYENGKIKYNPDFITLSADLTDDNTIERLKKENAEQIMYIAEVEMAAMAAQQSADLAQRNGAELLMSLAGKGVI
ncbi:DUF2977 domain-containing protein [Listeria monocytogenes]|uniref:DUF2977 domain-containing protein n=1 Tax=Listeria monocytogenes TaxID=1639 RepID=UPI00086E706C|nr:DUF2977 domain-containing protein [Listeria monocytogenes]EAE5023152.1 DUF2977 domain-containing protein [Listeria monocytogenes]EAG6737996.1 DUF2977 domain-containing protein [Listeria monocytogenes]OEP00544.1 hypothetical protein AJZ92_04355 [Listeria monocytogenes]